ncbi:GEVED domain-containing protein [Dokdonella immobilis]|uniref:Conserved repeat domain-containing protein n=1 Tax=Dokdonella immobilis TaxID=578942 RepID=A0A1I4YGZ9_9GAMM|nr:GEVED domain-containing protein [Dokdonella immobilis]SFN37083.1 conserved repeat domain-containing protein [Dokdonella immobilis]
MHYAIKWVLATFFMLAASSALAQQTFTKTRISGAGPFNTNTTVTYRLQGSCNNLVSGCGTLRIEDAFPAELVMANCPVSAFFNSITCTAGSNTLVLVRNSYAGGDSFSLDVNLRIVPDITVAVTDVVNRGVAGINGFVCPPPPQNAAIGGPRPPLPPDTVDCSYAEAAPVGVNAPTPRYTVRKQRQDPATSLAVAAGEAVTYRVQICSTSASGNMPITSATLVDTLPDVPGLTAASVENSGGGIVAAGPPVTITWTLDDSTPPATGLQNLHTGTACANRTFVVRYPFGLPVGTAINNVANATIVPVSGAPVGIGPGVRNDTIGDPAADGTSNKSAPDVAPGSGNPIVYSITANTNNSNVRVPNFTVVERFPQALAALPPGITFASVSSGRWNSPADGAVSSDMRATVEYTTLPVGPGNLCDFSATTALATNIASPGASITWNVPGDIAASATCMRWVFTDLGANGPDTPRNFAFTTSPQVRYDVGSSPPVIVPSAIENCTYVNFSGGPATPAVRCANVRVEEGTPSVRPSKSANPTIAAPGAAIDFTLNADHVGGDSTAPIVNPVISDWLPIQLEFVSLVSTTPGGGVLQVIPDYGSTGRTLVRVAFTGSFAVGSPGPQVVIRARVREGVPANLSPAAAYLNDMAVFLDPGPSGAFTCPNNSAPSVDVDDLDNDGSTTDLMCPTSATFRVSEAFLLGGEKWVEGDPSLAVVGDPSQAAVATDNSACPDYDTNFGGPPSSFTRFPCVARTDHGGNFRYRLRLANAGNRLLEEYVVYDTIPFIGDTGVGGPLSGTARLSRWAPVLDGPLSATVVVPALIQVVNPGLDPVTYASAAAVQIEYTTTPNFCRGQVRTSNYSPAQAGTAAIENSFPAACTPGTWSTAVPVPASATTGFRIRAFSNLTSPAATTQWVAGTYLEVDVPMRAPATGAPPSYVSGTAPAIRGNTAVFNPSWNSFAHRVFQESATIAADLLPTAEPPKVGVILPERYRLGNLVWRDDGAGNPTQRNNGRADSGEPGIDGVTVLLCRDTDGTAGPSAGDTLQATTVTATVAGNPGKYAFTDLLAGNDYYVAIANTPAQLALNGLFSTVPDEASPNADGDNNDNGAILGVSVCGGTPNSIASGLISLGPVAGSPPVAPEPTSETLRFGGADDDADGNTVFPDSASNYSVDFGFVQPVDLGDAPNSYGTLIANNGPVHPVINALRLGATVDTEVDGQPNVGADGDDGNGVPDDEDGVNVADLTQYIGAPGDVRVSYDNPNPGAASARICGFIDYDGDGAFVGAGETATLDVANGSGSATLSFGIVPPGFTGQTYARFRISSDTGVACAPTGPASDGEVEDYVVDVQDAVDFGDLPDSGAGIGPGNYETLIGSGGPSHVLRPGLRLGACEDAEINGQPNVAASGDDLGAGTLTNGSCATPGDDEDAVDPASLAFLTGGPVNVIALATNTVGTGATLCGFVDLNGDGDFADASETASAPVPNGSNDAAIVLNFGVAPPGTVPAGYARFRLSTAGGCSPNGAAPDGEVEDYAFTAIVTDLGDLPDPAAGTGNGNYRTLLADGGAVHPIVAGLFIGARVDAETDGQPNVIASGDDLQTSDDEDGVDTASLAFVVGQPGSVRVNATNLGSTDARLCGFIDFDQDGSFTPGIEVASVIVPSGSNNATLLLPFTKPLNTPSGPTFARFRLSTDSAGACVESGLASDGEVEDYVVDVRRIDLGDLPDTGVGSGPGNYQTLIADGGPQHDIVPGLFMGASVDNEADGQPSANADGDDAIGTLDDEDGVNLTDLDDIQAGSHTVRVTATNTTGNAARICGFIDLNADGDFGDTGESASVPVPNGSSNLQFPLVFGPVEPASPLNSYARFRLSTASTPCSPVGAEPDGEVEDYVVRFRPYDFGDLPDSAAGTGTGDYSTRFADNGPAHGIVPGLHIGACVDDEDDGQANAAASGDDAGASGFTSGTCAVPGDDEDGVQLRPIYNQGSPSTTPATVTNTTGSPASLCSFMDWNGDGDFDDANESTQQAIPTGTVNGNVTIDFGVVPPGNVANPYARFRLSTQTGCSPTGVVADGEVEDYQVDSTGGAMSLGNLVWEDLDNNGVVDPGEPGIAGVPVNLYLDANNDGTPDGAAIDSTATDGNGNYLFSALLPDTYLVEVLAPDRYIVSTGTGRRWLPTGPYEPAPDPDNDLDNDDNGSLNGASVWSAPVTLVAKGEPTDDGDADFNSNLSVDFGLLTNFDLALRKTLAPGQLATLHMVGENVDFTITVFNQGTIPATDITVIDHIPVQLQLNDPSWTALAGNRASISIAGPLAPGASVELPLRLRLVQAFGGTVINSAEISSAGDEIGNPIRDKDSDPDADADNDGPPLDDAIDNQGQDEDDADFAGVGVAVGIPSLNLFGLLALSVVLLAFAARRLTRTHA